MDALIRELAYLEHFDLDAGECDTLALLLQATRQTLELVKVG